MSDFVTKAGAPYLPVVTDDGSVPVAVKEGEAADPTVLLLQLIWEVRALRRAFCEDSGVVLFEEYPG